VNPAVAILFNDGEDKYPFNRQWLWYNPSGSIADACLFVGGVIVDEFSQRI